MSEVLTWHSPEAMEFLTDLRERLERGEEPTDEDREKIAQIAESLKPVIEIFSQFATQLIEALGAWWENFWSSLPQEIKDLMSAKVEEKRQETIAETNARIRAELHDRGIPVPQQYLVTDGAFFDGGGNLHPPRLHPFDGYRDRMTY